MNELMREFDIVVGILLGNLMVCVIILFLLLGSYQ